MSFKRRKPPEAPQIPQQPQAQEVMDIIDELAGTQTITVTGPDGKKRRVTQRLPRTPQEEELFKKSENLMTQAVNNIDKLYKYDPTSVADYQPFINAFSQINDERMTQLSQIGNFADIGKKVQTFRDMNKEIANREFDRQQRMGEESLARRGLQRSTMAAEQRALMAREKGLLDQQADVNANLYGEDLMSRQLGREGQVYDIHEAGRQGRLQQAQTGYDLERQKQEDLERLRQQAISENMNLLGTGQGIKDNDLKKSEIDLRREAIAQNAAAHQAHNQNQHYANEVSRITNQHKMNLDNFNATPPSFGQKITDLGLSAGSQYLTSQIPGFGAVANTPNFSSTPSSPSGAQKRKAAFSELQKLGN